MRKWWIMMGVGHTISNRQFTASRTPDAVRRTPCSQRGISLIPALLVLTSLFVLAAVYFGLVLPDQTRRITGLLKGTASSNLAETGLNRAMALLSRKPDLDQILVTETGFSRPNNHVISTSQLVQDANGRTVGQVDLTIDSGDPASGGRDPYGNPIWFTTANKNHDPSQGLYRFGITAWGLPFKDGTAATSAGRRGVYAVVAIPGSVSSPGLSPSVFFLFSLHDLSIAGGSIWYGPIESEGTIHFWWDPNHNQPIQIYAAVTYAGSAPDYTQYPTPNSSTGIPLDPNLVLNNPAYFVWDNPTTPNTAIQPQQVTSKGPLHLDINTIKALTNANCGVVSDPAHGCYVGDQDFQNTFFGPPGLTVGGTPVNPGDVVYIGPSMDIQLTWDPTHLAYFYRPTPPNGVILVVNGTVYLGGLASGPSAGYAGPNTLIDGRLAIVSYTTQPQNDTALTAPGNIVIYGNVVYRNVIDIADPKAGRQVDPATNQYITNADGSPTGNGTVDALGLFASHYVWVYVPNLYQPLLGQQDVPDYIQVFGQIIAGAAPASTASFKNYYPPNTTPKYRSYVDNLILYGAIYSAGSPEMDYFSTRSYFFDRALGHPANPRLPGLPLFAGSGPSPSPSAAAGTPRIVSGTWREIVR